MKTKPAVVEWWITKRTGWEKRSHILRYRYCSFPWDYGSWSSTYRKTVNLVRSYCWLLSWAAHGLLYAALNSDR